MFETLDEKVEVEGLREPQELPKTPDALMLAEKTRRVAVEEVQQAKQLVTVDRYQKHFSRLALQESETGCHC